MGCCSSRNEITTNGFLHQNSNNTKTRSTIDIFMRGSNVSRTALVNSLVEKVNLKMAILKTIDNLEESEKFKRQFTSLDNKEVDVINYSALKVKKYFKDQKPNFNNVDNVYTDDYFPPNKHSLYGLNKDGTYKETNELRLRSYLNSFKINENDVAWLRPKDIFIGGHYSVFTNDIDINDVEQGLIGNCYFMSSLTALAPVSQTILQLFRSFKVNHHGYYEIILKIDGEWNIVIIDDFFPCDKKTKLPIFARPNGPELWVMLLEKAWAKINGGYLNIVGGQCIEVLSALTPFPIDRYDFTDIKDNNEIWKLFKKASDNNYIMTCGTKKNFSMINEGLIPSHGFSVISVKEGTISGELVKLIYIRNPYGFKEWQGKWSDKSDLWTAEAKKVFANNNEDKDDGLFYMSFEDFIRRFQTLDICKITSPLCTKLEILPKDKLGLPNIYELIIYKQSKVNISLIKKNYRYHRKIPVEDELVANIILFSIDEDKYTILKSTHQNDIDPNIEVNLPAGSYLIFTHVIYKYSKYDKTRNVKLYITNNNYFDITYKGTDSGFNILKKLIFDKVNEESNSGSKNDVQQSYKNIFENTAYGYHYLYNNRNSSIRVSLDNQTINFDIIYPEGNILDIPNREGDIVIGFRKHYYEEFLFRVNCKIDNLSTTVTKNETPVLNISDLAPVNEDRYNFIYKRMKYDVTKVIEVIDEKLTALNYFLNKYPADTESLMKIPELEDNEKV
jgi:hypothetical protein